MNRVAKTGMFIMLFAINAENGVQSKLVNKITASSTVVMQSPDTTTIEGPIPSLPTKGYYFNSRIPHLQ